ncbi:hypothetical protein MY3957_006780 [Beauveria namnaoensis]
MYMAAEQESGGLELGSPFPGSLAASGYLGAPLPSATYIGRANAEEHEFLARGRIQYYVEMRLRYHDNSVNDGDAGNMICAEHDNSRAIAGRQMVSILPALPELPPLPLYSRDFGTFLRSKSISIRKNLLQRSGRLKVSSTQPATISLSDSLLKRWTSRISTAADFASSSTVERQIFMLIIPLLH